MYVRVEKNTHVINNTILQKFYKHVDDTRLSRECKITENDSKTLASPRFTGNKNIEKKPWTYINKYT